MIAPSSNRSELYLRFSRRSMVVLLCFFIAIAVVVAAMAVSPDGAMAKWVPQASWMIPFALVIAAAALQGTLKGNRWTPDSPEVQAIMQDEWRRRSMDRAMRAAFAVVLIVQTPLALALTSLPQPRAVVMMAALTIALGMSALTASFLFFDRD